MPRRDATKYDLHETMIACGRIRRRPEVDRRRHHSALKARKFLVAFVLALLCIGAYGLASEWFF